MVTSSGAEAVDLARDAGLILDGAQSLVLDGALGERANGKWAAFEVGVIEPRQNGKGSILEARELAGLFLFGERLILHSAHEFKTAQEAFIRIKNLIDGSADLSRRVKRVRTSHGDEGIELHSGQRLRFVARSTGSGRGFTGDVIILDEAYNLSPKSMAALVPTLSARPNPQIWYTSSAPFQTEESAVLRAFCRRGRTGGNSLAYFEWCADADDDQADPATWFKANPALGSRISEEFVAQERETLGSEFARERLGIWADVEGSGENVLPRWPECFDEKSGIVGRFAFALDVPPERDNAYFAVAGEGGKGGVHVELLEHEPGTGWVVERAAKLYRDHGVGVAVAAQSPAASLIPDLERAKVPVLEVSTSDHARACGELYDAVEQGRLRHLGQPTLDAAVSGAERKYYGDAWLWGRRLAPTVSPLVAVTLAKWHYETAPRPAGRFVDLADYVGDE